jgi:rhamnulokinase
MSSNTYAAVDLGAESGRVILGTLEDGKLSLSEVNRFSNKPERLPDGLHWDVLRLWSEIKSGISQAAAKSNGGLEGIGMDTWGVDFALLDHHGALLANPHHYRDNRTDGMMDEAFRRMPRAKVFDQTGIQFMQINTLFQLLSLRVNNSPLLDAADTFLTVPDLFNYWMTGEKVCEFTNATTTQCYDPRRRVWALPVLDALGIPSRLFKRIVSPGTTLGTLLPDVAEETGAGSVPVVAPACHDTGSAVAAVPATEKNFAWISSGTWSIMGIESPEAVITPQSLEANFTNEGGIGGTFRFSKNIMGLWLVQECRRTWAAHGKQYSYGELAELAFQARPLVSIVDPDYNDFLKPGDMPSRIQAYCKRTGQPVPDAPAEMIRCVLESIALKYRWVLERLEAMSGQRLEPVYIIGGGTQNVVLNQLAADATNRVVITGPVEATAAGNVLVQAMGLGHLGSLADVRAVVHNSFAPHTYTPRHTADWDAAYARLLALMASAG